FSRGSLAELFRASQRGRRVRGYRETDRKALERGADLIDFARFIGRQRRDGGALVYLDLRPAFAFELAQGLANRDGADGGRFRDRAFHHSAGARDARRGAASVARERDFGAALRRLAEWSPYSAGHPEVKAARGTVAPVARVTPVHSPIASSAHRA